MNFLVRYVDKFLLYYYIDIKDGCTCPIMTSYIKNLSYELYYLDTHKKHTEQNKLLLQK